MALASMSLSLVNISTKLLLDSSTIKTYEVAYWQGLVVSVTLICILSYQEEKAGRGADFFKVPKEVRTPFILRGVFGFTSNILLFQSLHYIPLSKMTVLFYTNPIFIALIAYVMLKIKMTNFDIAGILATFIGVYIFSMDPFNNDPTAKSLEFNSTEWWSDLFGTFIALLGSANTAGAMIAIRKVGGQAHFLMLGLVWGLANALCSLLIIFVSGDFQSTPYGWTEIKYLAMAAFGVTSFQICVTLAFLKEQPARVAPLGSLQLILNCLFDFFVLRKDQPPKYNQILGGAVILISNVTVSVLKCKNVIK